jgi:methyl-accepting chemotaxis protein
LESSGQVSDGVKLVNTAGAQLEEIVESIKNMTHLVSDIAASSKQQANGVEEINRAINDMDEMTQQNSAMVEENAAAARALEDQSKNMHELASFFSVDGLDKSVVEPVGKIKPKEWKSSKKPASKKSPKKKKTTKPTDDDWAEF